MNLETQEIRLRTSQVVQSIDINPTGSLLAIGQQGDYFGNPNLTLWQVDKNQPLLVLEENKFLSIKFTRFVLNGYYLVYIKNKDDVHFYDMRNLKSLDNRLKVPHVKWLAVAEKSDRVLTVGEFIEAWNLEGERIWHLPNYKFSSEFNVRPALADITYDGARVGIAGHSSNQILIYDINKNELLYSLEDAPSQVQWISFSPSVSYLATIGAFAKGVFIWDLINQKRHLPRVFNQDLNGYWSLCFHPLNGYIALGSLVGFISFFRISDGELLFSEKKHEGRVWDLKFSPDGTRLFSGGDEGVVKVTKIDDIVFTRS